METQLPALASRGMLKQRTAKLFAMEKISLTDIDDFTNRERRHVQNEIDKKLKRLKGDARHDFLAKIDAILHIETKNDIWEQNHLHICTAISENMRVYGTMPNKTEIADETGLSRQTVAKHLREYQAHPEVKAETRQFQVVANRVLASMFKSAVNGDVRAARLYLELVGAPINQQSGTLVNEQNNYIQINNTILSQENLERLTAEQLNQIEIILTGKCKKLV